MVKLIIFDFDNTVFDYAITEKSALQSAFEECNIEFENSFYETFKAINRELWLTSYRDNSISLIDLKVIRFRKLTEAIGISSEIAKKLSEFYTEYSKNGVLIDGVEALVDKLYGRISLAIASNGSYIPRKEKLRRSSLHKKMIFFSTDYLLNGLKKPNPYFYYKIIEFFRIEDLSQVIVVGDDLDSDILCANYAGIKSIWFRNYRFSTQITAKPDYIVDQMIDILELPFLKQIN